MSFRRSNSKFTPLSDEDEDDFANFSLGDETPKFSTDTQDAHSRDPSGDESVGHLYATHQSTAGMRAAERQQNATQQSRGGTYGASYSSIGSRSGQNQANAQDTLQAIKAKSASLAGFIRDKATAAGTTLADPEARQTTLSRFKLWGAGAAEKVSNTAASGWQSARELTAEGLKRLQGGPLEAICKQEHNQRPCPRTILVLCTALCTNGLYTESIFKQDAPSELTYYLLGALQEGNGLVLPPAGTDPLVIASAVKQFLLTLPEPLLTYKGVAALVAAGRSQPPSNVQAAFGELPAASLNALFILLETWHRVAENSAANGMDAMAIAVAVAPCLAWSPPLSADSRKGYQTIGVPVVQEEGSWRRGAAYAPETAAAEFSEAGAMAHTDIPPEDLSALISVLEYSIVNFKGQVSDFDGPLYDVGTPLSHSTSNTQSQAADLDQAFSPRTASTGRLQQEGGTKSDSVASPRAIMSAATSSTALQSDSQSAKKPPRVSSPAPQDSLI